MPREAKPKWHKDVKLWYGNIGPKDGSGRRTEVYAPSAIGPRDENKAWKWFHETKTAQEETETPVAPKSISVTQLGELYLAWAEECVNSDRLSPEHFRSKQTHIGHLGGFLGKRPAAEVTPHDIERFIDSLTAAGYEPNYIANICSTVSALFNWGKTRKHWAESPIKGFKAPIVPRAPERYASNQEAAIWLRFLWRRSKRGLAASKYDRMQALMQRMLIRTGARPKELCCLLWTDIKWGCWETPEGNRGSKATIPASRWKSGDTTGEPRLILISPVDSRALKRLRDREDRHPTHVFVHGRGRGGRGNGEPWKDGSTVSKTICRLRRELIAIQKPILEKIRLKRPVSNAERNLAAVEILDDGDNRLVNYRWRHTAASYLIMKKIDVPTVAKLLGTSPDMIYRHYGHILSDHLEDAAHKLMNSRGRKK